MKITIEKNIPMPERLNKGEIADNLRKMNIGDSIVIETGKVNGWRSSANMCKIKLAARSISDTESRVWRVK